MQLVKFILFMIGLFVVLMPDTARAGTFTAATACNGGGASNICSAGVCDLTVNGGSGDGTLIAVSVFRDITGYYPVPATPPAVRTHDWEVWGTDTAGNNYWCLIAPGDLEIYGSPQFDNIALSFLPPGTTTTYTLQPNVPSVAIVEVWGDAEGDLILGSSHSGLIEIFHGEDGDDEITVLAGTQTLVYGGDGEDWIYGGSGINNFFGGDGPDHLKGAGSTDWLDGEGGDDEICGAGGADTLFGGADDDVLVGGTGVDALDGGSTGTDADTCEPDDGGGAVECETSVALSCPF